MLDVMLFRDFEEDQRRSMEIYADNLAQGLREIGQNEITVHEYTPQISKALWWLPNKYDLKIRYSRYISYPKQAVSHQKKINHIIEDGYTHLIRRIAPQRTIITVHDLMPLLRWKGIVNGLGYSHRPRLYEYSLSYLRKAACVIAMSENTKRDLIEHCGCDEDSVKVSYQGIAKNLKPAAPQERMQLRKSFGLPGKEIHVILITGHQLYKNHRICLQVIQRLQTKCRKKIQLVRLGRDCPEWKLYLKDADLQHDPIRVEGLTDERLQQLYNSVDCLLFPSAYEGFGRPPLEAMACGTPVVASTAGALPEVVADAGLVADSQDVEGLAEAVHNILENLDLREELVQRGITCAKTFTWKRHATDILGIYRNLFPTIPT